MPKENTHVYFANIISEELKKINYQVGNLIAENIYSYRIGSYLPDIFYYDKKYRLISEKIHKGNSLKLAFSILDDVKKKDAASLSLIFGILSHFALDIIMHPIINSQNKNFYDHVHFETALDKKINGKNDFINSAKKDVINSISTIAFLEKKFNIEPGKTAVIFKKHFLFNKLFRFLPAYILLFVLNKIGILSDSKKLGIFYGSLVFDKTEIKEKYSFIDPNSGKNIERNLNNLFDKSIHLAVQYIISAYNYKQDKLNRNDLAGIMKGESLDTGRLLA